MLIDKNEIANRGIIYMPDAKNPEGFTIGEIQYFKGKLWKLNAILGYDWTNSIVTKNAISFSTLSYNINPEFRNKISKIYDDLNALGIKTRLEVSEAGFTSYIKISLVEKNVEILDKMYDEYVSIASKHIKNRYKYCNSYYTEEQANKHEYIKENSTKML